MIGANQDSVRITLKNQNLPAFCVAVENNKKRREEKHQKEKEKIEGFSDHNKCIDV
jgi:hypothetical protein